MVGGYSVNLSVPCPLSALDSRLVLHGIQCRPPVWGWLGSVDGASTFDLFVTQQGLVGAVTHGFQLSRVHHCAREFSRYRLVKYSRAGCLHPLEEWAQNQASPCLATPGCSFQPKAPCQTNSGEANITSADVLPFYREHNKSFQDDLLS